MDNRSASIAADIESGREQKAKGEEYFRQYEKALDEAAEKRKEIIDEARQKALAESEFIIKEARDEALRIIKEADEKRRLEQERMYRELQQEIASLAIAAATKVIEENMDNEKNRSIIDRFLSTRGAA